MYGNAEIKLPNGGGVAQAKDAWAISDTVEYGHTTLHVNYHQTNMTVDAYKPLFDGFRQFGPEGIAIADKYDIANKRFRFIGLGASYDPGDWFLMGEWGSTNIEAVIGKRSAWYVSGGYRLGKFTPYLTYAQAKTDSNTADPGLNVAALPPYLAGSAASLNAGLSALLRMIPVQKTISVGTRWDFMKNTDLKLQFDHIQLGAGMPGTLTELQPGFQMGGKVNVFSATIDFVF
jgi:predicted porin